MRFIDFQHHFQDFLVISLADIRLVDPEFDNRRLVEWQAKGYIKSLRRGYYLLADHTKYLNEQSLFVVANKIYSPSYVSLETALYYYAFIPEFTASITSVASRKTQQFQTDLGEFVYRRIKPSLMFGYQLVSIPNDRFQQQAKLATPAKAILDLLYFHAHLKSQVDFSSLRLNKEEIRHRLDLATFKKDLARFESAAMQHRATRFLEYITN